MFGRKKKDIKSEPYRRGMLTEEMILETIRHPKKPEYQKMIIIPPPGGFEFDKLQAKAEALLRRL